MRSSQPPRIASWLLKHFGSSPNNDAVIGDLNERYGGGRSRGWYWWQVAVAIASQLATEVRLHKLTIIRALLIGTACQVIWWYAMHFMTMQLISPERVWEHPNLFAFIALFSTVAGCAINGRLLSRLDNLHAKAVILSFICFQFVTILIPIGRIPFQPSWIFQIGGGINGLVFQLGGPDGIPLLNPICDICGAGLGYVKLHLIASCLIATATLLIGSGVLSSDPRESGQPTVA